MTCPVCGGGASRPFAASGSVWLRCRDCGGASLERAASSPPPAPLPAGRPERALLEGRAAMLRRLAPGRRLLDIGAGSGDFVAAAASLGLAPVGLEPAAVARARAAAEHGIALLDAPLESLAQEYHAVTLWDRIDREEEPAALVRAARRLLLPGGVLALSLGNAASLSALLWGRRSPFLDVARHGLRHQVTRRGLAALLDRAGMTLLKLETRGGPDLRRLAHDRWPERGLPAGRISVWLAEALSGALLPLCEALDLGDTMTAFARR